MMFCGIASAQFAGIQRGQQEERTPKEAAEALKIHDIKHIVYHESQGHRPRMAYLEKSP